MRDAAKGNSYTGRSLGVLQRGNGGKSSKRAILIDIKVYQKENNHHKKRSRGCFPFHICAHVTGFVLVFVNVCAHGQAHMLVYEEEQNRGGEGER